MSDWIEQEQRALPPGGMSNPSDDRTTATRANPLVRFYRSARRHWLLVLGVWILVGAPMVGAIQYTVKPSYTASADVHVMPVPMPLLYSEGPDPIGAVENYLNTQAEIIASSSVLRDALADPSIRDLPLVAEPDPMTSLRRSLKVTSPPRTNLLRVSIEQATEGEAIRLTRAVMRAYAGYAGGKEAKQREENIRVLRKERERLSADLKRHEDAIAKLGERYKATNQQMFLAMRENVLRSGVQTAAELERARIEELRLKSQLNQLEQNLLPTSMPADNFVWKEQKIESDLVIKRLREEIAQEEWYLLRYGENAAHRKRKGELEAKLDEQMKQANERADAQVQKRSEAMLDDAKRKVREQIAGAHQMVSALQASYESEQSEAQDMGRLSLEIQQLQTQADSTKKELEQVADRLRQLDIESHQPARVTVGLEPEILPNGVSDRRGKLTKFAILGSLMLGIGLACLKDIGSGRLYTMDDMEGTAGLRLLGALPALEDLRRGRVSEDDFRESYRAIRATLAGQSPGGQIPRALLVTSAQAAEGKTSLAVSLGASLAESGSRVLVVDGDIQAPRIAQTLNISPPYGLRQVLTGERPLADAVGLTSIPGLEVLLSGYGDQSAGGVLTRERAANLLKVGAEHYSHVIVDSPPVLGSAEALIWAQAVDGVILSSFSGHSSLRLIRQACHRIAGAGGKILGTVICNLAARDNYCSYPSSKSRFASGGRRDAEGCPPRLGNSVQLTGTGLTPRPGRQN